MSSLIGRTIDNLKIETQIGVGGMATVYRARDLTLERDVAIKVMHAHFAQQDTFRERFLREARAAARLDHPAIIKIFDFGNEDNQLFMATEYVPTGSLATYMKRLIEQKKMLPISETLRLLAQVADALDYAHRRDIIHRDIKPDNILIKELDRPDRPGDISLRPIVMDFGLAKLLSGDSMTRTGTFMGTLAYMSPEQALAKRVDGRSDIYSLGVILYQLATGKLPFEITSPTEAVMTHLQEVVPPPQEVHPGVPKAVADILKRALAKDANDRYASAELFAKYLRTAASELTDEETTAFAPAASLISLETEIKSTPPTGTVVDAIEDEAAPAAPSGTVVEAATDSDAAAPTGTIIDLPAETATLGAAAIAAAVGGTMIQPSEADSAETDPPAEPEFGGTMIQLAPEDSKPGLADTTPEIEPPSQAEFGGTMIQPRGDLEAELTEKPPETLEFDTPAFIEKHQDDLGSTDKPPATLEFDTPAFIEKQAAKLTPDTPEVDDVVDAAAALGGSSEATSPSEEEVVEWVESDSTRELTMEEKYPDISPAPGMIPPEAMWLPKLVEKDSDSAESNPPSQPDVPDPPKAESTYDDSVARQVLPQDIEFSTEPEVEPTPPVIEPPKPPIIPEVEEPAIETPSEPVFGATMIEDRSALEFEEPDLPPVDVPAVEQTYLPQTPEPAQPDPLPQPQIPPTEPPSPKEFGGTVLQPEEDKGLKPEFGATMIEPASSIPPVEQTYAQAPEQPTAPTEPVFGGTVVEPPSPKPPEEPQWTQMDHDKPAEPPTQPVFGATIIEDSPQIPPEQPSKQQWTEVTPQHDFTQIPEQDFQAGPTPTYGAGRGQRPAPAPVIGLYVNPSNMRVEPGDYVNVQVTLHNQTAAVDHLSLAVEGKPSPWSEFNQQTVQLMPGQQMMVPISFRVPRNSEATAGNMPFKVTATSRNTGKLVASADASMMVNAFSDFSVDLKPSTLRHNRNMKVTVTNSGNQATKFKVNGRDPAGVLTFDGAAQPLEIGPGQSQTVNMKVKSHKRAFIGRTDSHPFEVRVTAGNAREVRRGELVAPALLSGGCIGIAFLLTLTMCLCSASLFAASSRFLPEGLTQPIRAAIPAPLATPITTLLGDFAAAPLLIENDLTIPPEDEVTPDVTEAVDDVDEETPTAEPPTEEPTEVVVEEVDAIVETLTIGGQANVYLAGLDALPPDFTAPGALPTGLDLGSANVLTFDTAEGTVTASPALDPLGHGADGGELLGSTDIDPYAGISGIVHDRRSNFLIGVFLGDGRPEDAPNALDVSKANQQNRFAPQLGQTFFVGDGLADDGTPQQFMVPSGASRLYLGFADGFYFFGIPSHYDDNDGELKINVNLTEQVLPAPDEIPLDEVAYERLNLGASAGGLPIRGVRFGSGPEEIVIVSGLHAGYAPNTISLAKSLVDHFIQNPGDIPEDKTLTIIVNANPDSPIVPQQIIGRLNANGVDLNRNFDCIWRADAVVLGETVIGSGGTGPLSEPESLAISTIVTNPSVVGVISYGAAAPNGAAIPAGCNHPPRHSRTFTQTFADAAGYPISEATNTSTLTGDMTDWLDDQAIPAASILLPDHALPDFDRNLQGVLAILNQ